MRDNSASPHTAEDPAAPLIQADPSLPTPHGTDFDPEDPATANIQYADKSRFSSLRSLQSRVELAALRFEPPRSKPLFRGFERPSFSRIGILTVLCLITYPAFYILKLVAKDKSLFAVRAIVSVWCSGVGFALGYILLKIGARHIEAASEFALIGFRTFLRHCFKQLGLL